MAQKDIWQRILSAKWAVASFLGVFSALLLLATPFGIEPGWPTFISFFLGALMIVLVWFLAKRLNYYFKMISDQREQIATMKRKLEASHPSHCCVLQQDVPVCPLGVTRIHNEARDTLGTSLQEAKHIFRWLGFTAFNVVHNNREIFASHPDIKFEFLTVDPAEKSLLNQVDKDYRTTLRASEQAAKSKSILSEIAKEVHPALSIQHHRQLPNFRVILIDESRALVSFYEKGKDALRSPQIEFAESEDAHYCLVHWFQMFYDKVMQTEELLGRKNE